MKKIIIIVIGLLLGLFIGVSSALEINLLGPSKYHRTKGKPNVFTDTFWGKLGPGRLIIQNGEANGEKRVSSALILLNGKQLLGPNIFNQKTYNLDIPVSLLENNSLYVELRSAPASYLTIQIKQEGLQSAELVGPQGGIVNIKNYSGDMITLEIPPLALSETTSISMTALAIPPPNPIAKNVFPGVILEPSGLIFSVPVRFQVAFHEPSPNSNLALLFWVKNSFFALPIANQTKTQNSLEGEITHFSEITGGEITEYEIYATVEYIAHDSPIQTPNDILAYYSALMELAKTARAAGLSAAADYAESEAKSMLSKAWEFVQADPPPNPCGSYSNDMQQLASLILSVLDDALLAESLRAKCCTFRVSPSFLSISPGESRSLIAELFDPSGNQRSCSSLNWSSSNSNFVDIASTNDNSCSANAVNLGSANISANCDGLLGSATVEVKLQCPTITPKSQAVYELGRVSFNINQMDSIARIYVEDINIAAMGPGVCSPNCVFVSGRWKGQTKIIVIPKNESCPNDNATIDVQRNMSGYWRDVTTSSNDNCGWPCCPAPGYYYIIQEGNSITKNSRSGSWSASGTLNGYSFNFTLKNPITYPGGCQVLTSYQTGTVSADFQTLSIDGAFTERCPNPDGSYFYCEGTTHHEVTRVPPP